MDKLKIGTCWLDGCSGCHMSLLDIDEGIVAVLQKADIVFGPLVDAQEWPEGVDVALIEGAVSSQDDLKLVADRAGAQQGRGGARRLRGDGQRAVDAQRHPRPQAARARLRRGRDRDPGRARPTACPRCSSRRSRSARRSRSTSTSRAARPSPTRS